VGKHAKDLGSFAVLLFLGLFSMEAMTTAVEEVIDRISPEISIVGKHAKDLGSFAVLLFLGLFSMEAM
ncbi:diacylglycerol kinase, partial [Rhizobium ruizarguesonis]